MRVNNRFGVSDSEGKVKSSSLVMIDSCKLPSSSSLHDLAPLATSWVFTGTLAELWRFDSIMEELVQGYIA